MIIYEIKNTHFDVVRHVALRRWRQNEVSPTSSEASRLGVEIPSMAVACNLRK